jgi:hypothetical protein
MKKQILISPLLFAIALSMASISNAQSPVSPVKKGSVIFNAGVGIGNAYNSNYYNKALGTKAALEVGLWQAGPGVITLGVQAGGTFSDGGTLDNYKAHTLIIAGRSAWHHGWNVKGLDAYAGLSAGAGFNQYSYNKNEGRFKQNEVIPVFGAFVGVSYFITPSFGFNIEAGRDITQIQGGIVLKLK